MKKILLIVLCLSLLCGCSKKDKKDDTTTKTDEQIKEEAYNNLSDVLFKYIEEIYDTDEWARGNPAPGVYKTTLRDLEEKGKDISMFINPITKKACDLDKTYGRFIVIGQNDDGTLDYTYTIYVECELNQDYSVEE